MSETETVGLNLDGSFAAQAEAAAAAARELEASLGKLEGAGSGGGASSAAEAREKAISGELEKQVRLEAQIATFDAQRVQRTAQLEAHLKKMTEDATGVTAERQRKEREQAEARATQDRKKAERQATQERQLAASNDLQAFNMGLQMAEKLFAAAERLIEGAIDLGASAVKLEVAETSKREVQSAVFGKLGGDYEQTVKLALNYGIDEDKAVAEVKGLLNAKFKQTEIPVLVKVAEGLDLAKGEGKGAELLDKLQKINLEPKVKSKDVDSLAALGVDTNAVYTELGRKLHTDVAGAMAKVKSGAVDAKDVIEAIGKVGNRQFGDLADTLGGSVPALLAHLKGDLSHLFDAGDLQPIKDFLQGFIKDLEDPNVGGELKHSITDAFNAFSSLFKEVGKDDMAHFLKTTANAIEILAEDTRAAAPYVGALVRILDDLFGAQDTSKMDAENKAIRALGETVAGIRDLDFAEMAEGAMLLLDAITGENYGEEAYRAGVDLVTGFAQGIEESASNAISAAEKMAEDALASAKKVLGIASRSKEFVKVGGWSAEGLAGGMDEHPGPAQAGAAMARRSLGAAAGASAAGVAGGAGAAAGGVFAPVLQVTLPPGSAAEHKAGAEAGIVAALPQVEALYRRMQRDAREGGARP